MGLREIPHRPHPPCLFFAHQAAPGPVIFLQTKRILPYELFAYPLIGWDGFTLTQLLRAFLILHMPRAIKRQFLSPLGWTALVMGSIAAIAIAWSAAYLCVRLMSSL